MSCANSHSFEFQKKVYHRKVQVNGIDELKNYDY
jgi:hypothetical protein